MQRVDNIWAEVFFNEGKGPFWRSLSCSTVCLSRVSASERACVSCLFPSKASALRCTVIPQIMLTLFDSVLKYLALFVCRHILILRNYYVLLMCRHTLGRENVVLLSKWCCWAKVSQYARIANRVMTINSFSLPLWFVFFLDSVRIKKFDIQNTVGDIV